MRDGSSAAEPDAPTRDGRVCVLTFHRVVERCELDHDVSSSDFKSVVDLVVRKSRAVTRLEPSVLADNACVITFDDGTADHMAAAEELQRRGLAGIFYIPTGTLGTPGFLARSDVAILHEMGHAIGSHTVTHVPASGLTDAQIGREMADSKHALEDLVSEDVVLFAPPGGVTTPHLPALAEEHGFSSVRLMRWGIYHSAAQRWSIPCAPVTQFAIRRQWIDACIEHRRLPASMRASWMVKRAIPKKAGFAIRGMLNRSPAHGDRPHGAA